MICFPPSPSPSPSSYFHLRARTWLPWLVWSAQCTSLHSSGSSPTTLEWCIWPLGSTLVLSTTSAQLSTFSPPMPEPTRISPWPLPSKMWFCCCSFLYSIYSLCIIWHINCTDAKWKPRNQGKLFYHAVCEHNLICPIIFNFAHFSSSFFQAGGLRELLCCLWQILWIKWGLSDVFELFHHPLYERWDRTRSQTVRKIRGIFFHFLCFFCPILLLNCLFCCCEDDDFVSFYLHADFFFNSPLHFPPCSLRSRNNERKEVTSTQKSWHKVISCAPPSRKDKSKEG